MYMQISVYANDDRSLEGIEKDKFPFSRKYSTYLISKSLAKPFNVGVCLPNGDSPRSRPLASQEVYYRPAA